MKWIGQHIYDYISRFRNHTYFEDSITLSTGKSITMDEYTSGTISISKIQDSGTTFNDNDTSLMTAAAIADKIEAYGYSTTAGDITGVTAGTNLSGGGSSGDVTVNLADASTSAKGAASFNSDEFSVSSGAVSLKSTITWTGTIRGQATTFSSVTSAKPVVKILNTTNDTTAGTLNFVKDKGAAGADGDDIGTILFTGDNSAQEQTNFASIVAEVSEADDTDEAGKLTLNVAESDGSTSALSPGLILEGEHATDGQVDATIGNGSASTTTVAGDLAVTTGLILDSVDVTTIQTSAESFADNDTSLMTSAAVDDRINTAVTAEDLDVTSDSGTIDIDLNSETLTIAGGEGIDTSATGTTVSVAAELATSSNLGVATFNDADFVVSEGDVTLIDLTTAHLAGATLVTESETIASNDNDTTLPTSAAVKDHVEDHSSQIVNLKGFCSLTTNYQYTEDIEDTKSPFEIALDYGSATIGSGTEVTQATLFRTASFHVPFAVSIKSLSIQVSCSGTGGGNVTVAVAEYRPSEAGGDTSDYPRTIYEQVAVGSNNSNNKIKTVTVATGDLDNTAVPAGSHIMILVKGDSDTNGDKAFISAAIEITW